MNRLLASVEVAPLPDQPESLVVAIEGRTLARRMEHQLVHRNAALSMTAMAAMLAHEVRILWRAFEAQPSCWSTRRANMISFNSPDLRRD